jgi:poly(3-hydroxyoctanoate) depolymerase
MLSTAQTTPSHLFFLPGALGRTQLWEPVASMLTHPAAIRHIGWPGFSGLPPDPNIHGLDDLVDMVSSQVQQPTALIAQSMGGVIAIRVALQKPQLITNLVLTVTSGGIDVASLGGQDWRASLHAQHPHLPDWFSADQQNLTEQLKTLHIPALLLWGDADPISPVAVGEHLASLLPCAQLHIIQGGNHDLAETHACAIAPLIEEFLVKSSQQKSTVV